MLARVGNNGKYQVLATWIFFFITLLGSSSFFVIPFLFYKPPYLCNGTQSPTCYRYVCSLPPDQRTNHLPPNHMHTLASQHPAYLCQTIGGVTAMEEAGLEPANSEVTMRASTEVELDVDTGQKVLRFLDILEDLDDTQAVYSNADIPDEAYDD